MFPPTTRRSPSPPSVPMSTSAYALNARQHPRTTLFSSTVPSPPPGLFRSTLPATPPGLPIRNSVSATRTGMQSPPRFVAARAQTQSQPQPQTHAVRRGSQEKVVPAQVSRQEVIRQTEPVRIGQEEGEEEDNLDDLLMSNLSPSTELNRAVAFSVAESALEGDSEDDGIDIDHRIRMLERRMTNSLAAKPTTLSAAAPIFQFNPKVTLPWEEAEAKKVGMDVLSYQRKQMHVSQGVVFRPAEPLSSITIDTSSLDEEKPRKTLSHSRSRSDIPSIAAKANNEFVLNTPIQPSGSFATPEPEKDVQTEQEAIALLPPPRCITPLPFKRPSFAEAMLMPGIKSGMPPTLAEISARYKAGRARSSTSGSGSDKETNANANTNDWPARPKRYSLDSTDSMSEQSFGENGSTSTSGPSLPATPRKSRLPAFLQHARTNSTGSSGSDDVILYSPTKSISFMDELCNQVPQTPESTYPVLKVTPPSVENVLKPRSALKTKSGGPMQVMLEDGEDCSMPTFGGEVNKQANGLVSLDTLSSLPTITCTPATAPGIAVSPLAMLEAQVKQNQRVEKRQERAQIMLSTLQRRNRAPGVAA